MTKKRMAYINAGIIRNKTTGASEAIDINNNRKKPTKLAIPHNRLPR
jgi:hypothetical protein